MLALVLVTASLAHNGPEQFEVERADMVELHHMYNFEGAHVYTQIIIWKWHDSVASYHIDAYTRTFPKFPQFSYSISKRGGWYDVLVIGKPFTPRTVRIQTKSLRERHLQWDPVYADLEKMPWSHQKHWCADNKHTVRELVERVAKGEVITDAEEMRIRHNFESDLRFRAMMQ